MINKIAIVSYDAGGAEIISAWVKKNWKYQYKFILDGPAVSIFRRKLLTEDISNNLDNIYGSDFVITGSGWGSEFEKKAIAYAKKYNISVVTYLDHWTRYQERFQFEGQFLFPNEIWVGDEYAFNMARRTFKNIKIKLETNLYFQEILDEIKDYDYLKCQGYDGKKRILYVCEPRKNTCKDPNFWGYTEFQALEEYLRYLLDYAEQVERVRIRLHPSEQSGKYNNIMCKFEGIFNLVESHDRPLFEDCAWADWIVGCDSMAMVIGLLAGKKVFSCIPAGGREMTLPYPEIIQLFKQSH